MDKYTELPPAIAKQVKKVDQMIADRAKAKETPPAEPPVETPPVEPAQDVAPAEPVVETPAEEPPVTPLEPETVPKTESEPKVEEKPKSLRELLKDDPRMKILQENLEPQVFEAVIGTQEKVYELATERARETISQEVSKVDKTFAKTKQERFWDDLRKAYPNWGEIRVSPDFQTFTNEVDPLTGVQRYWIIKDAFDQFDAGRVIRFLDVATGKGNPPPVVDKGDGKDKVVSDKVKEKESPPKSSGPAPSSKSVPTMTVDEAKNELVKIANLKNRGQWRGTEEEYKKKDIALRKIIQGGSVSP